jgi:DnaJ homolog subfamily C member 28
MPDIEEHIRKAIQEGQFADLPGKGKPLPLDDNPYVDPEWRLAHHLLKSSGYTLPWIEKRQQLIDSVASARAALRRAWNWRQNALAEGQPAAQVALEWQHALTAFREQILALNKEISGFNLEAPSPQFQLFPLNPEQEIDSIYGISR